MKKKLFAILLCLAILLSTAASLNEVSFAQEEKTFILKKADGTVLGQYDEIKDGWDENTILGMMKKTDINGSYIIEVTKDYEFESGSRPVIGRLNITFTSKEGTSPVLTSGNGTPHFFLANGNYTFKNIILEGKSGSTGGGIHTHNDNQCITITLDEGTVIRNCNYIGAPYVDRSIVIRDIYTDDGKDSKLIINDGVTIEGCKTNSSYPGCAISVYNKCKLIVNGGTFKNNYSQISSYGGSVIFNDDEAETIINGGTFEGNKAKGNGGAVVNYGKLTINGGTFKDNAGLSGGAISSMSNDADLIITGGTFANNKSTDKWGGAIVAKNKVSVKNAIFENNYSGNGGAIFAYDANNSVFESCTFKNNGVDNEKSVKQGGALFVNGAKAVSIKNNTFTKNTAQDGGALFINNVEGNIEGNTFEENFADRFSSAFHVKKSSVTITSNTFKNNGKNEGKVTSAGTFMVESVKNNGVIEANGNTFENNIAGLGGAAVVQKGIVDFNGCTFNKNNAAEYGGAMYITRNATANITNSKFIGNSAKRGGAIVTEPFSQANPAEKEKYANLTIADDVEFDKNFASDGYFNPPTNYKDFPELKFKTTSLMGKLRAIKDINELKTYEKVDSVLNNYDVYYANPLVTVLYDSNGGSPAEMIYGEKLESENDEIKPAKHTIKALKETGLTKEGFEFKEWNTQADGNGTAYKEGDTFELSSNKVLYAIWEKQAPAPTPKPSEPTKYILTLDENYRGGEITNIEVEEGELIAPYLYIPRRRGYIFRGWSYDKKHFDEVKPEDRIYSDTILYAIWKKAEIEKHEEPEEIRGDDHKAYIFGYPNGTVRPNGNITRAEAAAMLSRLLNIEAIGSSTKPNFKDTESSWYNKAINAIVARGIMKGYPDGRFRPNAPITRAEFTQMISTIDNKPYGTAPFIDVKGHWAERAIGSEYQAKRITGYPDGLFRPNANITRAEAAVILNKIFERNFDAMSLAKCKNALMLKRFIDLDETFWGYNDMVEATNTHEYIRRYKGVIEEDWLLIK